MSRLSLKNVSISAGSKALLNNCNTEFSANELTVIFGRSGSGKTTLLKALCHLRPFDGNITLNGKDICSLPPTLVRQQIQYLHQEPYLFPGNVRANLLQLKEYRQHRTLQLNETNLIAQLERVGLPAELLDRPAELLSGGEKQRLCIVRSLLVEPQFLLLDEPSSALDIATEADLILLLKTLSQQIGIIAVSHSISFIQAADRALLLRPEGLQQLPLPLRKTRILELVENGTTDS